MAIVYSFATSDGTAVDPKQYVIIKYDDGSSRSAYNPKVFATVTKGYFEDARDIVDALNGV